MFFYQNKGPLILRGKSTLKLIVYSFASNKKKSNTYFFVFLALKSIYMKYEVLFILFLLVFNCKKADTDLDMKISAIKPAKRESEPNGIYSADKMDSPKEKNKQKSLKQAIFVLKPMI
jgi:hypothetical protein